MLQKMVGSVIVILIVLHSFTFAGSLVGVSPGSCIEGKSVALTIEAEGTSFTGDTVLAVWLVKGGVAVGAKSFRKLNDTFIEAEFNLSENAKKGLWTVVLYSESGILFLEECFTVYDPDVNGDGLVDTVDFSLYARHFLEVMAGYALVPDLTSLSQSAAEQKIADAGLTLAAVEKIFSDTVAAGLVISQNPSAGKVLPEGAIVAIIISKGPELVTVPDLSSLNQSDAENAVIAAGLSVGTVTEQYSSTVTAGLVISQSPLAGVNAAPVSAVDFVISLGEETPAPDITWVSIIDPGVSGHEGFTGDMSKYETTNAQYCQFLNAALATGDIIVDGTNVKGASGTNTGADFAGQVYYDIAGAGNTYSNATNGGAARINYASGSFIVDSGFENHPATYVSWYGATAFCNYYGWRLPTEWEWQAVADYDGTYTYGCGTSINGGIANYYYSTHPYGTTAVGAFGTYGYGMADMAGNLWEWTSSVSGSLCVFRGGCWADNYSDYHCSAAYSLSTYPDSSYGAGFRVCR